MVTQQITLYCSFCGKSIGGVVACPSCGADNVFLNVTPPDWVVEELAEDTKLAPPVGQRRPPVDPAVVMSPPPPPPATASASDAVTPAQAAELRDDFTVPLQVNDDRTVPLPAEAKNPVVAILMCRDDCSPGQELRHELREGETTVGRRDAQILVPNEHVSKKHALIRVEPVDGGQRILLLDRGSGNGTFVNGTQLAPDQACELHDGDTVAFANVCFLLRTSEYLAAQGGQS